MAAINDLIDQIENPTLRLRIQQEVAKMSKQRKFGLVFEDHVPENIPLYELPIRRGLRVAKRDGDIRDNYQVLSVKDGIAECEHLDDEHARVSFPIEDLIAVAQFGEPIYPCLKPMDSVCNAPDSELWHTLIEADNYHALQLLVYLYGGKVDCIYIDPPYNTGARDWKYNNNYVDGSDSYRHSKWLSMIEKRLLLAKRLLNPDDSVLIVTIDEKEYLHLGCLLEDLFPEASIQMVSDIIHPSGVARDNQFARVEEYIFYVFIGDAKPCKNNDSMLDFEMTGNYQNSAGGTITWRRMIRAGSNSNRERSENCFYPIFINKITNKIQSVGFPPGRGIDRELTEVPEGCVALWPLHSDGSEGVWQIGRPNLIEALKNGTARLGRPNRQGGWAMNYLNEGMLREIQNGAIAVKGKDENGALILERASDKLVSAKSVWNKKRHDATQFGTYFLNDFLGGKRFSYPKSIYAVHDTLRFFVANKPNALILDFFAGSGTTLHAVNLLNAEDGGHRRCIMVTNNEIGDAKEKELIPRGIRPGDNEWEKWGIARYVNWPRTECSINGVDVNGKPIDGEYITSLMETKVSDRRFYQINFFTEAPSLKQKKALISLINKQKTVKLPSMSEDASFLLAENDDSCNASILFNATAIDDWKDALEGHGEITDLYIVTQKDSLFRQIKTEVSELMGPIEESVPVTMPMKDGFKANAIFFKLGFLDKTSVALRRQFTELLPILWMKAGARGECPRIEGEDLPKMLICEKNHFAVLIDENAYLQFEKKINETNGIDVVYIITDSDSGYKEMAQGLHVETTYQLYRDYLDNFRINNVR